jgi:hypothetical protein
MKPSIVGFISASPKRTKLVELFDAVGDGDLVGRVHLGGSGRLVDDPSCR